jgi:hypothetical protein
MRPLSSGLFYCRKRSKTMADDIKAVHIHDLKARLSEHLNLLRYRVYNAFVIRRYGRDIAFLTGVKSRAEIAAEDARRHANMLEAARKRFAQERRVHAARLLSWPGAKNK